jgi:hypothetical protein
VLTFDASVSFQIYVVVAAQIPFPGPAIANMMPCNNHLLLLAAHDAFPQAEMRGY